MEALSRHWQVVLVGLLGAGCAPAGDCPTDWCGTVVVSSPAEAASLFPTHPSSDVDVSMHDFIFEKLADIGSTLNTIGDDDFVPVLAESWTFPDNRTIRFTISGDARWHDGNPVTADDVVFTFDVYRDPVVATPASPRLRFIESVTAVDERTVDITFERMYPEMFFDAVYHVRVIPRHVLGDVPQDQLVSHGFARSPVGSGPFRFVEWRAAEFIELSGDSTYHRGRPGIRRIVWRFTGDPQQSLTQLLAGEVDALQPVARAEDQARVDALPDYRTIPHAYPVYAYISFNFRNPDDLDQPHPLFSDAQVRTALAQLVDIDAVVDGVLGEAGRPAVGPLTPMYGELHDNFSHQSHLGDVGAATLSSLGWADSDDDGVLDKAGVPFEFDLLVPNSSGARVLSSQIVQEQLRGFGIQMNIIEADHEVTFDQAEAGRFDAVFGALLHDPSPSSVTDAWTSAAFDGYNYGHYSSPEFDQLAERALLSPDLDQAMALWQEAFQAVIDDVPAIWVYVPDWAVGLHERFENVTIRPDQWTATLWEWRVDPRNLLTRDLIGSN